MQRLKILLILSLILNFITGVLIGVAISGIIAIKTITISGINDTGMVKVECLGQEFNYYYE